MKRNSMILTLALFIPACDSRDDEPASDTVKSVIIKRTADEAVIQSVEGETLRAISPEDLVLDAVEERKQKVEQCYYCDSCYFYDDWIFCYDCAGFTC